MVWDLLELEADVLRCFGMWVLNFCYRVFFISGIGI